MAGAEWLAVMRLLMRWQPAVDAWRHAPYTRPLTNTKYTAMAARNAAVGVARARPTATGQRPTAMFFPSFSSFSGFSFFC